MDIESKFLFISKFFIVLFIIINTSYLIPFDFLEVSFYTNLSTVIVDTATLLILGLAFPKFVFLKNIKKLKQLNNPDSSAKLEIIKKKCFYNTRISQFVSVAFVIIVIIQPINIIFTLNKNDIYSLSVIESFNNKLKIETKILEKELNITNQESINSKDSIEINDKKEFLKQMTKRNINNFIERNNKNIFNQIKFIIRNLIMGLIWALVFYKLSRI
tara:strand:+ start:582 stop:1229 length:648 start_codon:yes stop_codon:yes gene_type:complete